jgi:hypothetical protein
MDSSGCFCYGPIDPIFAEGKEGINRKDRLSVVSQRVTAKGGMRLTAKTSVKLRLKGKFKKCGNRNYRLPAPVTDKTPVKFSVFFTSPLNLSVTGEKTGNQPTTAGLRHVGGAEDA